VRANIAQMMFDAEVGIDKRLEGWQGHAEHLVGLLHRNWLEYEDDRVDEIVDLLLANPAFRSYWQRFASGELKPSSHERPKVIKLPPDGMQLVLIQHELTHRDARDYRLVQYLPTDIEYGRAVFAERVKAFQEATAADATVDRLLESVAGSAVSDVAQV
jgi:MmyB-like transcription regulator ligand binding domain